MAANTSSTSVMQVDFRGLCCNHQPDSSCTRAASLACKCLMVAYCNKRCQAAHWPIHRSDCNSPMLQGTWKPRWIIEERSPAFIGPIPQVSFGRVKYFWGNVPALDVIQLGQNEGVDFQGPINLLFAASGDLRNIILSVGSLPETYKSPLSIVINDLDLDIVARNLIFLLIMFVEDDRAIAAEAMIHVWYSTLVTESCYDLLQTKLKPLIKDICDKIVGKPMDQPLGKTWHFGNSSLRVILTREAWNKLLSYFDVPNGMTKETAHAIHQAVVNAPSRVDYADREALSRSPTMGLGMFKYREDGILIPFGQSRKDFVIPNPTFFDSSNEWLMMDSADPLSGWSAEVFLATRAGPAKQDAYGQLYHYLRRLFMTFHQHLHSKPVAFELHHKDARVLNKALGERKFDRVEVSNVADQFYLGIRDTLKTFRPFLRDPSANRHATLITCFLNAVFEAKMNFENWMPIPALLLKICERDAVMLYLGSEFPSPTTAPSAVHHERSEMADTKANYAMGMVTDMDLFFDLYMNVYEFEDAASSAGVEMKTKHTIIKPWPLRVNINSNPSRQDKEEFKRRLGSSHTGQERYVEWKVRSSKKKEGVADMLASTSAEANVEQRCALI